MASSPSCFDFHSTYLKLRQQASSKMALVLAMSSTDNMSPTIEVAPFEDFPPYEDFPTYEDFPPYEDLPPSTESTVNMAESTSPRSPRSLSPLSPTSPISPTNKLVEKVAKIPGRLPSPQPTHFSAPYRNGNGGNGYRVLRSATVGYTAPEFKGKKQQMVLGKTHISSSGRPRLIRSSKTNDRSQRMDSNTSH